VAAASEVWGQLRRHLGLFSPFSRAREAEPSGARKAHKETLAIDPSAPKKLSERTSEGHAHAVAIDQLAKLTA